MKPREYCCCALPLINAGIYAALTEQFVAAFVAGILSMATPSIVGAATPSFASWLFGIVCLVTAALQLLGFIAVAKEKSILFRRYLSIHTIMILAVFSLAAAWTIVSATRHSTAKSDCINDFFDTSNSDQADEADTLCQIFPWVDVGIMGGLWVLFAIVHVYLYVVLCSYSSMQQKDHAKYNALNDSANAFNDSIPMNTRGDPWDTRPSTDAPYGHSHTRQASDMSMSDVMAQPVRRPTDEVSVYSYSQYPPQPADAHTTDEHPTPKYSDSFYGGPSPHGEKPAHTQSHPGQL